MMIHRLKKHYDRIDISKGIDVNKTSASKECIICNYWCFLDKESRLQRATCNGSHDGLMSIDLNSIYIKYSQWWLSLYHP